METREKDFGLAEITVNSLDKKAFSMKSFASTNCKRIKRYISRLCVSQFNL